MLVKKVKAHRLAADVPESEMFWWKGNEAADKWAKLGAEDRNEAWGDLVDDPYRKPAQSQGCGHLAG